MATRQPEADGLIARGLVTPESIGSRANFSRARSVFDTGLKISMAALYVMDAPDVAYVRLVETSQHTNDSIDRVPATMHVTLVWRPEIAVVPGSSWRIHHLGEPMDPGLVPRTPPGTDPRRLT